VRDTGPGFDPASYAALYQPVRPTGVAADGNGRSHHRFAGSGLGLAICSKLVRAMDSELRVETRPNWGSRFFFEIDCPMETMGR